MSARTVQYTEETPTMGVIRVLDWQGKVMDSTMFLGGTVRFGRAKRYFTATMLRLDLPTGQQIPIWLDTSYPIDKDWTFTARLPRLR